MVLTLIQQSLGLRPREKRALCGKMERGDLKGLNQAKIVKKSVRKVFNFCAAYSPVRLDIEPKFPISYF